MMSKKPVDERSDPAPGQPSFESALKRLEEIVHLLEEGDIGLQESLERYEEGVKLLRQSYDLLERAERRIELLSGVDAEGNPITQPFDDTATFGQEEPGKRRSRRRSASNAPPESSTPELPFGEMGIDEPG
jgi:exodeoxyribonuclease VII small subunit